MYVYALLLLHMYICIYCTEYNSSIHTPLLMRPKTLNDLSGPFTSIQVFKQLISVAQRILILNFVMPLCSIHSQPRLPVIHKHMHSENRHEVKANDRSSFLRTPYLNYPIF